MDKGLCRDTNSTAAVKMLPTFVRSTPDGTGDTPFHIEDLYVHKMGHLDTQSTHVRPIEVRLLSCEIKLKGQYIFSVTSSGI